MVEFNPTNFWVDYPHGEVRDAVIQQVIDVGALPISVRFGDYNEPFVVQSVYTKDDQARLRVREALSEAASQHPGMSWHDSEDLDDWKLRDWWLHLAKAEQDQVMRSIEDDDMSTGTAFVDLRRLGWNGRPDRAERTDEEHLMRICWPYELAERIERLHAASAAG